MKELKGKIFTAICVIIIGLCWFCIGLNEKKEKSNKYIIYFENGTKDTLLLNNMPYIGRGNSLYVSDFLEHKEIAKKVKYFKLIK